MSTPAAAGDARVVSGLVSRIVQRLPCNSGIKLSMLKTDVGLKSSLDSLIQLATLRPGPVLQCLASSLDVLARYSSDGTASSTSLDALQSQIYILHVVDTCLTAIWRHHSEGNPPPLMDLPRAWPDPPALDDQTARQLLGVALTYARLVSSESNLYPGAASPPPSKDGRVQASSIVSWGNGSGSRSSSSTFSPTFIRQHSYSKQKEPDIGSGRNLSFRVANNIDAAGEMTRLVGQIVFFLSTSNWPLVLIRIKGRLAHLTTTIEDTPDLLDLRLLEWSNVNRQRLGQVLQEASSSFLHIKRPAQIAFAASLHSAIWNWLEVHPIEFDMLVESNRKLEGGPDGLFDILFSMADFSSSNAKRAAVFYPLMAALLVICPDLFQRLVTGEAREKSNSSSMAKKYSFLECLRKGLSGNKGFEPSVACYLDFIKAATLLAPRHDQSGLRSLVPEIQSDLKGALFFGSHSNDLTETRLPVEGLVALYRAGPRHINATVLTRLWTDSDISKLVAVRACARMHEEADRLPWHPYMTTLRADVAPHIRGVLKASISNLASERGGARRGRVSTESSPALLDLIYDILVLLEADPTTALTALLPGSSTRSTDSIGQLLSVTSTLLGQGPDELRQQAKRTITAILTRSVAASLETSDTVEVFPSSMPAAWQALMEASRQVLIAFHSGDSLDLAVACEIMREIVSSADKLAALPEELFGDGDAAKPALTVAILAILTSLAGPDVEQTTLSTNALADLARIAKRIYGQQSSSSPDPEAQSQIILLEALSKLPYATGKCRQQQQRQLRRAFRQHAQPSDILSAVWLGLSHRLRALMSKIGRSATDGSLGDSAQGRRLASALVLAEDETKEWLNLNALVGAIASCGMGHVDRIRLSELVGMAVLPSIYDERLSLSHAIETYIADSVNLLFSSSVVIRESVKEALGSELPLSLGRSLVSALYGILSQSVGPNGITLSESFTILSDQSVAVLRLMVERMQPGDPQFDVTELLFLLARYLNRLGRDDASLRLKMRFCQVVESIMTKDGMVAAAQDGLLRNTLLEYLSEWSFDAQKDTDVYQAPSNDRSRAQRDLDFACMCALLVVTDGLAIKSTTDTSDDTPIVVKARLFQRYLHHLQRVIERASISDDHTTHGRSTSSSSFSGKGRQEGSGTLVMLILSNLLAANIDVGLKHCLALGYHEDTLFRSAFIQVMSRLLRTGARFGGLSGTKHQAHRSAPYLDLLTDDNLAFAVAICEVCPAPEVDEMLALLFRSLEAKGTLLGLVKVMIEKEVAQTNHESELFRANTTTTKMLTVFGKTYGYNYVRATLQPLIHTLVDKPAACSFELDPSKAGPNEDIEQNADHLRFMCQALLDLICSSASRVPVMFRALCHQLWEIVEDRFPESRHSAVGSFIFLRFFCPAIISPEAVDLDVSSESREVRRALLLITKVIQNLANNVKFKEPHMQILNTFLAENIKQVTRYLSDIATRPRSWELAQAVKSGSEETSRTQDADSDNLTLHRFVFKHFARFGATLETMPPSYRRSIAPRSARADIDGKAALHRVTDIMRSDGEPAVPNVMSASARNLAYTELMRQNEGRDTSSVAAVFYEGPASQNGRRIFYFVVSETGLVDYDLLAYHIFSTLHTAVESFDVVIDLTDYSPSVDLPKFWLQRVVQMAPQSLIPLVNVIALYNANSYAKQRIRRIIADLVPLCGPVGKKVMAACSPSELAEAIPFTNLYLPDYTMALAYQADHVFTNLLRLSDHESHVPTVVKLGTDSLQVASWRKQDIAAGVKAYIIDVIRLKDIDDIVTGSGPTADHLTVKHSQNDSVVFVSRKRNELGQMIRAARARLRTSPSEERTLRPSDVPGTLLNIALLNLSASDEPIRLEAYNLINDVAKFFHFSLRPVILSVKAGLTIPTNSIDFARDLSTNLAKSAPQLTLDFLKEWAIGFTKANLPQKTACLLYVKPWVSNLSTFAKRSREDSEEAIKLISDIIRSLVSITIAERKRLHLSIQQHIWKPMGGNQDLADILLPALLETATDGGLGSDRVECVGDILCSISSTAIRGKVVARLRKTIAQTYLKPSATLSDNVAWAEICALARLNLMLSFTPADSLDAALFLPEIIHVLTLLLSSGPVLMRQTVYGLLINTLQSLASSSPTDGVDSTALQQALDKAQSDNMLACFDLVHKGNNLEMVPGSTQRDDIDVKLLDHVDTLARFLGEVLAAAAPNLDCANAWRARWTGLVVGTCFQHNPATQPQAFTVLGYLAADEVDDDLVYQILVAMSTTLSHMTENDSVLLNSMLRCLSQVIPGLLPDSRYASSLFWLAFAIAEMGYIPLFGAALELMMTALKAMNEDTHIDRVPAHLLEIRRGMGEAARKIDQIAGVSLNQDPSFCLVAIILKGVRHPSTSKVAIEVLLELLRLNTQQGTPAGGDDGPLISRNNVAYFVALLSVSANSVDDMKALFVAAGLEVDAESLRDLSQLSVFDLLSIPDNSSAIFLVTLIATSLNSASTDAERLILYRLLADASSEMPEVLSMAYDSLLPRLLTTLTTSSHPALIQHTTTVLSRALADPSYTFPAGGPQANDSQVSLQQSFQGSISSMPSGPATGGPLLGVLDDLGMRGLAEGAFTPVKSDRLSSSARWVAALIESFTL